MKTNKKSAGKSVLLVSEHIQVGIDLIVERYEIEIHKHTGWSNNVFIANINTMLYVSVNLSNWPGLIVITLETVYTMEGGSQLFPRFLPTTNILRRSDVS